MLKCIIVDWSSRFIKTEDIDLGGRAGLLVP